MTRGTINNVVTIVSLITALGLQVACGGTSNNGGVGGKADLCASGLCVPSGFPFANSAKAISNACTEVRASDPRRWRLARLGVLLDTGRAAQAFGLLACCASV